MKLSKATYLILILFGSFGVVLAVMIILLRPARNVIVSRSAPEVAAPRDSLTEESKPDSFGTDSTTFEGIRTRIDEKKKIPIPSAKRPAVSAEGRRFQKKLQQEKKEMTALRMEMERRLKDQVAAREQKIAQLARNCQKLEPGEAAGILLELDDHTVSDVLGKMDKDAALKITAILARLGR
jgi:flagellar motility protein MotE (MotC chaperone)